MKKLLQREEIDKCNEKKVQKWYKKQNMELDNTMYKGEEK